MGMVVHKTNFAVLKSVNTPDYDPSDWLINPDVSALASVPEKYWKIVSNEVVEMTTEEKTVVDNTGVSYQANYQVKTYDNYILSTEKWYETDNLDETYSGLAKEITYTYNANKSALVSKTEVVYDKNEDVISSVPYVYSTVVSGSTIKIVEGLGT